MPQSKNVPCEIRFHVTEDVRSWLRESAFERSEPVGTFVRSLVVDAMERAGRGVVCRKTDPLIELMHPLVEEISETVKVMAGKMGVGLLEKEPENSYQLEGGKMAKEEGAEVPPKCGT